MTRVGWSAVDIIGQAGQASIILVCEHASSFIPSELRGLGLLKKTLHSHIVWDIGAFDVAQKLCHMFDAPLISGAISRLVYDCNRPFDAPDAIPQQCEIYEIPGNKNLSQAEKQYRFEHIHNPFHEALGAIIERQIGRTYKPVILITLHSFTPFYNGQNRNLDIGYLFHKSDDIAVMAVTREQKVGVMRAAINKPYSALDGVTYTLKKHGDARGLKNVMVEIRNDLIDTPDKAEEIAKHLFKTLTFAIEHIHIRQKCAI